MFEPLDEKPDDMVADACAGEGSEPSFSLAVTA